MIEKIHIENYKSISSLDLELGRVTVLIGENGSGKSNILEAITFASAASQDKLDNEFLASRGIRVSSPNFMKSAFDANAVKKDICINCADQNNNKISYQLNILDQAYSKWTSKIEVYPCQEIVSSEWYSKKKKDAVQKIAEQLPRILGQRHIAKDNPEFLEMLNQARKYVEENFLYHVKGAFFNHQNFMIYSPENSSLRTFEKEAQIEPLGINGEGLYKLLQVTANTEPEKLDIIKRHLSLISWFKDFDLPEGQFGNLEIVVQDKYIQDIESELYNHKNTNEGFLFLLFYILLLVSDKTPPFFAIDNIDASLNPKLCTKLTETIVELAKKYDKQVILTTHNPAILDGINLIDDEQKIMVVSRNKKGHTKVHSVQAPKVSKGETPVKLSEAFLNGMIGGLPKNF